MDPLLCSGEQFCSFIGAVGPVSNWTAKGGDIMTQIVLVCSALIAVVVGAFGLGKVMFEKGYVHGYEAATHPVKVEVDLDDEE